MNTRRAVNALAALALFQMASACKNCVILGKEEKAMFRSHWAACAEASGAGARAAAALRAGAVRDEPALRRHVYCVLRRCKLVSKDGKLVKAARRPDAAYTRLLQCVAGADAAAPEDVAWSLFRCAHDAKAPLLDYMPAHRDT